MRPCPYCASSINSLDRVCPFCQEDVTVQPPPGARPMPRRTFGRVQPSTGFPGELTAALVFIGIDIGMLGLGLLSSALQMAGPPRTMGSSEAAGFRAGQGCAIGFLLIAVAALVASFIGLIGRQRWGLITGMITLGIMLGLSLLGLVLAGIGISSIRGGHSEAACGCLAVVGGGLLLLYGLPLYLLIKVKDRV